jgi:NADPH-dependent curcumin reductase CurA
MPVDYQGAASGERLFAMLREARPRASTVTSNAGVVPTLRWPMNAFGRIAVCGMIAGYDGVPIPMQFPQLLWYLASRSGLHRVEHAALWPRRSPARRRRRHRRPQVSVVAQGLDSAPGAFSVCSRAELRRSSWSS